MIDKKTDRSANYRRMTVERRLLNELREIGERLTRIDSTLKLIHKARARRSPDISKQLHEIAGIAELAIRQINRRRTP